MQLYVNVLFIANPLEALWTRFFCSINNKAVLSTFTRAIEIAFETEDAAEVAKETVWYCNKKVIKHQTAIEKLK